MWAAFYHSLRGEGSLERIHRPEPVRIRFEPVLRSATIAYVVNTGHLATPRAARPRHRSWEPQLEPGDPDLSRDGGRGVALLAGGGPGDVAARGGRVRNALELSGTDSRSLFR